MNLKHPSAALYICVDSNDNDQLQGKVYSQRITAPLSFSNLTQMILLLDHLFDLQKFPQAFQRARTFLPSNAKTSLQIPVAACPEEGIPLEAAQSAVGAIGALTLYVLSRRNATWQGTVDWQDGAQPEDFESALQLIHMIDRRF